MTTAVSGTPDTTPPSAPGTLTATAASSSRDRPQLGRGDRQRRHRQLPDLALPGRRLQQLQPGRDDQQRHHHDLPGHRPERLDGLQLRGARRRHLEQPRPVRQQRQRHHEDGRDNQPPSRARHADRERAASASQIDLSWGAATDNVGITDYQIERCQGAGCSNFSQVGRPATAPPRPTRTPASAPRPATATRCAPSTPSTNPGPYATPPAGRPRPPTPSRRRRPARSPPPPPARARSTSAGARRPTTSASAATGSTAAGRRLHQLLASRPAERDRARRTRTRPFPRPRATATRCARSTTSATSARIATSPPRDTPAAPSGLVAAYGFEEGSGTTVTDASGNGNTGTISGATWTTAGKFGNALSFNGTSSRVTIPEQQPPCS